MRVIVTKLKDNVLWPIYPNIRSLGGLVRLAASRQQEAALTSINWHQNSEGGNIEPRRWGSVVPREGLESLSLRGHVRSRPSPWIVRFPPASGSMGLDGPDLA